MISHLAVINRNSIETLPREVRDREMMRAYVALQAMEFGRPTTDNAQAILRALALGYLLTMQANARATLAESREAMARQSYVFGEAIQFMPQVTERLRFTGDQLRQVRISLSILDSMLAISTVGEYNSIDLQSVMP